MPDPDARIRVRLPELLVEQLADLAKKNGISLNKLIEHILREYLLQKGDT